MTYSEEDLKNIIAVCEQDEENAPLLKNLENRCQKALVYTYYDLKISEKEKSILRWLYDDDMELDAKATLKKILKVT